MSDFIIALKIKVFGWQKSSEFTSLIQTPNKAIFFFLDLKILHIQKLIY